MRDELFQLATQPTTSLAKKYANLNTHLSVIFQPRPSRPAPKVVSAKPRLTPGIIFSTPYNPPLPRYKPQPLHITMLLFRRRSAIQRRWDRAAVLKERIEESREETSFMRNAGVSAKLANEQWNGSMERAAVSQLKVSFERERLRNEVRCRFFLKRRRWKGGVTRISTMDRWLRHLA